MTGRRLDGPEASPDQSASQATEEKLRVCQLGQVTWKLEVQVNRRLPDSSLQSLGQRRLAALSRPEDGHYWEVLEGLKDFRTEHSRIHHLEL